MADFVGVWNLDKCSVLGLQMDVVARALSFDMKPNFL